MSSLTPAVRFAIAALLVSVVAAGVGGWLHVEALRASGRAAAREALDARVALVAGVLQPVAADRGRLRGAFEAFTRAPLLPGEALVLLAPDDRVLATSNADVTRGIPWDAALRRPEGTAARPPSTAPTAVVRDGAAVLVASRPLGTTGYQVAALRPAYRLPRAVLGRTLAALASLWGLLATVLVVGGYVSGPLLQERLRHLAGRLAQPDADTGVLLTDAARRVGPFANSFLPVVQRAHQLTGAVAGAREHVAALYQVNPHYVVLCTMDGHIVEANPAFYAVTGLPPEAIRGGRVEALAEVFPIEPLMELAARSLREGASIGGLEYALHDRNDQGRPVEVALRAFRQGDTTLVLFQATDVAVRRSLERRVAAFSDTLDLMVDQRVQQLAAGQQSLRRLLDAAGVAVASFDRGGATRRWSGAAQHLTGRVVADVPHFATAVASLGLADVDRARFTRWFWSDDPDAFSAVHVSAAGVRRPMVWRRVDADRSGSADHRTIVGMDVPLDVAAIADEALHRATGDGLAGDGAGAAVPLPPSAQADG